MQLHAVSPVLQSQSSGMNFWIYWTHSLHPLKELLFTWERITKPYSKNDFNLLFDVLKNCEKPVFISSPSPLLVTELAISSDSSAFTPGSSLPEGLTTGVLLTILTCSGIIPLCLTETGYILTSRAAICSLQTCNTRCRLYDVTDCFQLTHTPQTLPHLLLPNLCLLFPMRAPPASLCCHLHQLNLITHIFCPINGNSSQNHQQL